MRQHIVVIEERNPRTKDECGDWGQCETHGRLVSRVFISSRRHKRDLPDTFFHEMTHVLLHWMGRRDGKWQERTAWAVGRAAAKAFNSRGK